MICWKLKLLLLILSTIVPYIYIYRLIYPYLSTYEVMLTTTTLLRHTVCESSLAQAMVWYHTYIRQHWVPLSLILIEELFTPRAEGTVIYPDLDMRVQSRSALQSTSVHIIADATAAVFFDLDSINCNSCGKSRHTSPYMRQTRQGCKEVYQTDEHWS